MEFDFEEQWVEEASNQWVEEIDNQDNEYLEKQVSDEEDNVEEESVDKLYPSEIYHDLEQKIVNSFSKKDNAVYKNYLETVNFDRRADAGLFLSLVKVSMLIYGRPEFSTLSLQTTPRFDINAPIVDGMFPLHLAVMTSSRDLVLELLESYRAKLDVKCCGDPDSPFYGLTPLEMALKIMRYLIPWTPQMSVPELLSMFHGNDKVKSLMVNISVLVSDTPRIRHIIAEYALQGKVVEFAALLKVACSYPTDFSAMYIPTANIPPELHFRVPVLLRQLLATRSASLIEEGIQLSTSLNPEEHDSCRIKIKQMDFIRTLLESAERDDLDGFDVKQQFNVELTDGSSEGSQDEFKVSAIAPRYLKNSLLYVEPSKFQPAGVFNSLMPLGYNDRLKYYDGLDIRTCNALAETIFRVLDGRKIEELSLEESVRLKYRLESHLGNKFKEAETLTAIENKGPTQLAKEKKGSVPGSSLPRTPTTALKPGVSYPLSEAFKHLDVKKISSSVFYAIRKGKS